MDIRIVPGTLRGTVLAPASKSELHRYLICAAFADGPTVVEGVGDPLADDIKATIDCLEELGASFRFEKGKIDIAPSLRLISAPVLDCRGSGSTLRFLLPVTAALCNKASFRGSGSLSARPVSELLRAMEQNGAVFSASRLPLEMEGGLKSFDFAIPGNISSQYVSGLMMAGAVSSCGACITLTSRLGSAGYVEMTADALRVFGAEAVREDGTYRVSGPLKSPGSLEVKGSWSAAAGILAAAAASADSDVTVTGLDPRSVQGDRKVIRILRDMGADITATGDGVRVRGAVLHGTDTDVDDIPDLFPVLAAVSAGAGGISRFRNGSRLRYKESDRLESLSGLLKVLGVCCTATADGLVISDGGAPHSGTVDSWNDHRVVMAAAVAAYALGKEVTVRGAENISKSYPDFFEDLKSLGGNIYVV